MNLFDNMYCLLNNLFELLSFRTKPPIHDLNKDDEEEYIFIQKMER